MLSSKLDFYIELPPPRFKNHCTEEGTERLEEPKGVDIFSESVFVRYDNCCTREITGAGTVFVRPIQYHANTEVERCL